MTPRILRRLVFKFCEQKNIKTNFNTNTSKHAENVIIAGYINLLGDAIPLMNISKGKHLKLELYDNLPADSLVQKLAKGHMTNEFFKKFLKHLAKFKISGDCLLIFDGAACHLDLLIVDLVD